MSPRGVPRTLAQRKARHNGYLVILKCLKLEKERIENK